MKRYFLFLVFALASSLTVCLSPAGAVSNDGSHLEVADSDAFKLALRLFASARYEDSMAVCSSLLQKDPTNIDAQLWMGENLIALHEDDDAVKHFQQVLELNPKPVSEAIAFYGLGRCHQDLKQHEQAVSEFSECLKINSFYSVGYLLRGFSLCSLHEYKRAIEDYTMCISITKVNPSNYFVLRGDCYFELKQYENAVADYTAAITGDPTNRMKWNWYRLRAAAFEAAGEDTSARSDLSTSYDLWKQAEQSK